MEVVKEKVGTKKTVTKNVSFPVVPLFNKLIITLDKLEVDGEVVLSDNILSENQRVMAIGSHTAAGIQVGANVIVDIEKLMVPVQRNTTDSYETYKEIRLDLIEVDGIPYAIIEDRCIKAIDLR
jgi:hypothetical protein